MTRIAIDAMGGDHAPFEIVAGAVWAAADYGVALELVGKQDRIETAKIEARQSGIHNPVIRCTTDAENKIHNFVGIVG